MSLRVTIYKLGDDSLLNYLRGQGTHWYICTAPKLQQLASLKIPPVCR